MNDFTLGMWCVLYVYGRRQRKSADVTNEGKKKFSVAHVTTGSLLACCYTFTSLFSNVNEIIFLLFLIHYSNTLPTEQLVCLYILFKLWCRRWTARRAMSVETLSTAARL